ncbi:MAG: hypothetical protein NUW12_06015 [Firmicutes bacterium]|jgi:hypothetical protein|nr:hypothetical protein [Bacillota bacterium]MDH7495704.1 hypothetical protein [Bacillota bacterium]
MTYVSVSVGRVLKDMHGAICDFMAIEGIETERREATLIALADH